LRVITLNLNGIRSAAAKGAFRWLGRQRPDVVCLQEIRAWSEQHPAEVGRLRAFHQRWVQAAKKGYSGVGILSRRPPDRVESGIGYRPFDVEGRYLRADFGDLSVVSIYVPSGSHSEQRLAFKLRVLKRLLEHLRELAQARRTVVVCGDLNVAHREIDLANWRGNRNHPGFLPVERAWMDRLYGEAGWVDAFRVVCTEPGHYTWWSNRGRAWDKNVGWRLDYQVCTPALAQTVRQATIYKRRRFSDHAPLAIDYDYDL
jgi:exodeoxyribonuclease-3